MELEIPLKQDIKTFDGTLYNILIYDREPNGLKIVAKSDYNHLLLQIDEKEIKDAGYSRKSESLDSLLDTIIIDNTTDGLLMYSTNPAVGKISKESLCLNTPNFLNSKSDHDVFNSILLKGLVEVCKAKPRGEEAITWLGNWLMENNPNKPKVLLADEV